jgi:hypothetical protein
MESVFHVTKILVLNVRVVIHSMFNILYVFKITVNYKILLVVYFLILHLINRLI